MNDPASNRRAMAGRFLAGALYVAAGANHFLHPAFYLHIMPPAIPWPQACVAASEMAEIALGLLLFFRRGKRWAGWGIVALLAAVFPANLHMALHSGLYPEYPAALLWARIPAQGMLGWWAWLYTRRGDRS
jgi:uncharacterized membrane protein